MDDPAPIEIELTSVDGVPERPPSSMPTGNSESPGNQRSALAAVGIAAGVVGLLLGWVAGSSSGSSTDPVAVPVTETSVASPPERVLDTVPPPTTTRPPRTTTTTTAPVPDVEKVALHPALADLDATLVGLQQFGTTAEIDLSASEMTTRTWGRDLDTFMTIIGDGWVLTAADPRSGMMLLSADGDERAVPITDPWSMIRTTAGDEFWIGTGWTDSTSGYARFELVDRTGTAIGPTIERPGLRPIAADPQGGLLTIEQGSTYGVDPDGVELIGEGELVAATDTVAVLRVCDAALECRLHTVDRATGNARPVPVTLPDQSRAGGFHTTLSSISPDGSGLLLGLPGTPNVSLVWIDLETGDSIELTAAATATWAPASWTPDGRFAFFVDSGAPTFFDRVARTIGPVGEGLGVWQSIEVRPTMGATDG